MNISVMPAELEPGYSPAIDRIDVAIRAVLRLFRQRNWACLQELGVTKEQEPNLIVAELLVEDYRSDKQIAALLECAPFVLGAALECLRRYAVATAHSKAAWLKENRVEQAVPHSRAGRCSGQGRSTVAR